MAQPAITKRLEQVVRLAKDAVKSCNQYSSGGGWTPEEEQALRDTIDALQNLVLDAQAALELAEDDLTQCLNEQST